MEVALEDAVPPLAAENLSEPLLEPQDGDGPVGGRGEAAARELLKEPVEEVDAVLVEFVSDDAREV